MLIKEMGDHMRVLTFALLVLLVLICLLAPRYGADSRLDELTRRRRFTH